MRNLFHMETPTTSKWKSLEVFLTKALVVIGAITLIFGAIKGCVELKEILWANPQISDAQNCFVFIPDAGEGKDICFELLVNNPSSKDCSIISIDLTWPDGLNADLEWGGLSTILPKTIPAYQTEKIKISGLDHKWRELNPDTPGDKLIPEGKLELRPNQKSTEATVVVKFNTGYIAKKKITFIVKRN